MSVVAREEVLRRICAYIDGRACSPGFSLAEVAVKFDISDRHLRALFEQRGSTPSAYVRRQRLAHAARMLTDPRLDHLTTLDIACECGFSNAAHLARWFHRQFEVQPGEYRRARGGRQRSRRRS